MLKYIPAILFAVVALVCFAIACIPAKGGVDAQIILIVPAGAFAGLAILAGLIAWLL